MEENNQEQNDELFVGDKGFWGCWGAKLLFTLISVKFWGLAASIWISTSLLRDDHITNEQWMVFNTTLWGLIFGMKEVFRISQGKDKRERQLVKQIAKDEERLKKIEMYAQGEKTAFTKEGFEIVGAEPEMKEA